MSEQLNMDGQWEVAISEGSYPSMYRNVTGGMFIAFATKLSNSSEEYYLEHGFYHSIKDIVEAMTTASQKKHNHRETPIAAKVARRTQKVEIHFSNEGSGLALFGTDLVHIYGSNVGKDFGVLFTGKGLHKPVFAYDIVHIHSFLMYTDLIDYNFVGDRKALLLCCFPFFSKLKSGDIITTKQNMHYQT